MVNKAIIVGRLGADPEVRYTQDGSMVTNFRVATDMVGKNKAGEKEKKTEWHRIATFGKLAEICGQYLVKGSLVYIEGWLRTTSWEKDGNRFYATDIIGQSMKMLGGSRRQEPGQAPAGEGGGDYGADEDVPF
jgi:single-strand DNA-binding protein